MQVVLQIVAFSLQTDTASFNKREDTLEQGQRYIDLTKCTGQNDDGPLTKQKMLCDAWHL